MPFITCAGDAFTVAPTVNSVTSLVTKTSAAHHGRLALSLLSSEDSTEPPLPTSAAPLPNEVPCTTTKILLTVTDTLHIGRAGVWVRDGKFTAIGQQVKTNRHGAFDCAVDKTYLRLWVFADSTGEDDSQGLSRYVKKQSRIKSASQSSLPLS